MMLETAKTAPKIPWYLPRSRTDDIADNGHGGHHQATGAQALQGPEGDQLAHILAQAGSRRAQQEQHDGCLEDALATHQVADFTPQGCRGGRGQDIGGDDPGKLVQPTQIADDGRQGRGYNRLVECGQQHAQ